MRQKKSKSLLRRHGLSIAAGAILLTWLVLYSVSDDQTHWGSFFGNAIADWTGLFVMVLATKYMYERGSKESKRPLHPLLRHPVAEKLREHSLTIFLLITGAVWIWLFARSAPQGKWGQVVGNIVSEWTQILGLVLMTKKLREAGSKQSK